MFYGLARGSSSKLYLTLNHYPIRTSPRFLNPFFHQSVHAKQNRQKKDQLFHIWGDCLIYAKSETMQKRPSPLSSWWFSPTRFNSKKYFIFVLQYFLLCEWALNCIAAFFLFSADLDLVHAPSLLKKRSQYLDFYNFYKWILQIGFVLHCLTSCRTWKSSQDENVSISNSRWLWKLLYSYVYTYSWSDFLWNLKITSGWKCVNQQLVCFSPVHLKRTYLWTNLSFHLSMVFPFCTLKSKCSKNWNHIILFVFLIFPTWPTPTAGWHNSALPAYFRSMPRSEDTWLTWSIIAHRSEGDDKYSWLDKTPSSLVPVLLLAPNPLLGVLEPRRLLLQPLDWERAETF